MRSKFAGYALMLFPLVLHAAKLDQNLDPAVLAALETCRRFDYAQRCCASPYPLLPASKAIDSSFSRSDRNCRGAFQDGDIFLFRVEEGQFDLVSQQHFG